MSNKTDRLKLEFFKLSDYEKSELINFINQHRNSGYQEQEILKEKIRSSLGPTDSAQCGCCGK